jgi:hypothetical protein
MQHGDTKEGIYCISYGSRLITFAYMGTLVEVPFVNEVNFGWPTLNKDEDRVIAASFVTGGGKRRLTGRGTWDGAIVKISVPGLDFSTNLFHAKFDIGNVWPGAETLDGAYVQVGGRDSASQHQLVLITPGTTTYVADLSGRYIGLRWDTVYQALRVVEPTVDGIAEFLARRAERHCKTHRALTWTLKTLERLDKQKYWSRTLNDRLRGASRVSLR